MHTNNKKNKHKTKHKPRHKSNHKNQTKNATEIAKDNAANQPGYSWYDLVECGLWMAAGVEFLGISAVVSTFSIIQDMKNNGSVFTEREDQMYLLGSLGVGVVSGLLAGYGLFKVAKNTEQMKKMKVDEAKHFDPNSIKVFSPFGVPDSNPWAHAPCGYRK